MFYLANFVYLTITIIIPTFSYSLAIMATNAPISFTVYICSIFIYSCGTPGSMIVRISTVFIRFAMISKWKDTSNVCYCSINCMAANSYLINNHILKSGHEKNAMDMYFNTRKLMIESNYFIKKFKLIN